MDDEAAVPAQTDCGIIVLEHRAHDQLRAVLVHRGLHRRPDVDHGDRDLVSEVRELDQHALAEAVMRRHQEQDLEPADRGDSPVDADAIDEIAGSVTRDDAGHFAVQQ